MTVRVLHLRASNFLGGPERQILSYASADTAGKLESWIGTFVGQSEGRELAAAAKAASIPCWECKSTGIRESVKALKSFLREQNIALVCTHGYKATIIATLACGARRIPVVPFLRGWTSENFKVAIYERAEKALLKWCARVVCLSRTHADQIQANHRWAQDKVRVVVNASLADPAPLATRQEARTRLRQRFDLPANALCIVWAGRLSREKGPLVFIEAAQKIVRSEPSARFVMFGDGALRGETEARAASLGIADRVILAGLIPEFRTLFAGADLLINSSHREQMPNVVLEAMSCGVPVIGTRVGAVSELLEGGCGILVEPNDDQSIAEHAVDLLRDPCRKTALAETAAERLRIQFNQQVQHEQLRALYADVLPFVQFAPRPPSFSYPKISIVVPVRNEERHIAAVLHRLLAQDYPEDRFEIIIADGQSTDNTRAVVDQIRRHSSVAITLVDNPGLLSSAGRNAGVRTSTGEIIIFVDGHSHIPGYDLLYDTARLMRDHQADCLARPQPLRAPSNDGFQDLIAAVRESSLGHGRDSTIYSLDGRGEVDPTSSGATYRRTVLDEIGPFDEAFDACEDVELNHRVKLARLRSFIDPSLAIYYVPRANIRGLFKQMLRYGKGRAQLARKHAAARSLSQLVPAAFLLYLSSIPLLFATPKAIALLYLVPIALYLVAIITSSLRLGLFHGSSSLRAPLAFFAIHVGLGLGFLLECLNPKAASLQRVMDQQEVLGGRARSATQNK